MQSVPSLFISKEHIKTADYYYGARYYDPKISVWLSVDPILKQHESPYSFTSNNPIMFVDPDGRDTTFASKAAQERVNSAYNGVLKRMSYLEKKLDRNEQKFLNGALSDRKDDKYMGRLNEYSQLSEIKRDFDKIFDENSPCVEYEINNSSSQRGETQPGVDGSIVVSLNSGYPNKTANEGIVIHENTHVIQLFKGRAGNSLTREYDAYRRQAVYDPGFVSDFMNKYGNGNMIDAIYVAYPKAPPFVGTDRKGNLN